MKGKYEREGWNGVQNSLFQAICKIGIFMICARAIIQFRPREVYEKYLRFLAGIMILIQLFLPVGKLLLGKDGGQAGEMLGQFRQELEQGMEEAAERAAEADAILEHMTLEEVRKQLEAAGGENLEEGLPEDGGQEAGYRKDGQTMGEEPEDGGQGPGYRKDGQTMGEEPEDGGQGPGIRIDIEPVEPVSPVE